MAPNYNTLPMRGHTVSRASEKKFSTVWRVIAESVAFVVEGGITKNQNSVFLNAQMQIAVIECDREKERTGSHLDLTRRTIMSDMKQRDIEKLFAKLADDARTILQRRSENAVRRQFGKLKQDLGQPFRGQADSGFDEQWAEFQVKHSQDLNTFFQYCPDLPPRLFERYLPGIPLSIEALRAERAAIAALLGYDVFMPKGHCETLPVITFAPDILVGGGAYTIIGTGFGAAVGTLTLHFDSPSVQNLQLTIVNWTDTSVRFTVPTAPIPGLPLHASGTLILVRHDQAPGGIRCTTKIGVAYEPAHVFLRHTLTKGDKGLARDGYSRDYSVKSPPLPARAEPHPIYGSDVLLALTYLSFEVRDDPCRSPKLDPTSPLKPLTC